jgi:carotenoid cleavage dioxygenase-like enzyme
MIVVADVASAGDDRMASEFFNHPYLTGHHEPSRMEVNAPDLIIEGKIPDDLEGIFYRNGPEPAYPPIEGQYHWFDGDGMIYAFHIRGGRVSMRNRWVRTDKLSLELEHGRRLFGLLGNPFTADPLVKGMRYNTGNTNVILHGGKLLALMEGAPPVSLGPLSLETFGEEYYGGTITTTFSAHPKVDLFTGEMVNLGGLLTGQDGQPQIRFDVIDKNGTPTKTEFVDIPHMSMMHTFFLSENWVVFPVMPLNIDTRRALKGGPATAWLSNTPSRFGLMPRRGTPDQIRWLEMEPRHMFHEFNVWEEGENLIADVAASTGTGLFPDEHGNQLTHAETTLSLRRWTFDLSGKSDDVKEEILNGRDIQFPRPDDRRMTRATQHGFANLNLQSADGRADGMDGVIHFNTRTGAEDIFHFGAGSAAGELVFAPRLGSIEEADGYAITLVHPANSPKSELAIFDARNIAAGPIARVIVPFRVSSGFHCTYYSADSDLYSQAIGRT